MSNPVLTMTTERTDDWITVKVWFDSGDEPHGSKIAAAARIHVRKGLGEYLKRWSDRLSMDADGHRIIKTVKYRVYSH